jgi:hypothetical protein
MRSMTFVTSLAAMASLAACAAGDAQSSPSPMTEKQAKLLKDNLGGKVAGEPVRCISGSTASNVIRVSDDMLLYRVSGRLVYQNQLRGSCPGLARDSDVIVSEQYGSQLCSGDTIRLVDRMSKIPGPVCILGDFVPYRKPDKATGS